VGLYLAMGMETDTVDGATIIETESNKYGSVVLCTLLMQVGLQYPAFV